MPIKKIIFVFHGQANIPTGGPKMVYEYADFLAKHYRVEIVHLAWKPNTANILKGILKYVYFLHSFGPQKWFRFSNPVVLKWVFKLSKPILEDADVIIATAWETAELIYRLKVMKRVVYFIQGDESLFDEPVKRHWQSRVIETWKYPWKKIVIAEFLREQIKKHDALDDIIKIPNGLDFNKYTLRMPVKNRNKYHITMLAHRFILKGTVDGIKALEIVRRKHCGLQVTVFSAYPKMEYIPDWIDYRHNPEQSELIVIYNNAAIFISSSHTEGFGLTLAEAMACGCATAVTDIPAYHDFTIQNETSLFSPVGDYTAMADNIMRFIESDLLRESFARSGYEYIRKKLSLEKSCNEFMKMIEGEI